MRSKASRTVNSRHGIDIDQMPSKLHGGFIATLVHKCWGLWRRYQLRSELERKLEDQHFLNDVGLTRADVAKEIELLRRQK
ncbi:hypothetical protein A1OO_13990 [Enterovibrio norvegicus FF-33]|uniref:DUF1127 domain-containing protein n=1 Tax=Enterovibrio norvegicus FF-454 TaxID=1185651 RepID=A0A1E5CBZ5_9GAMM|nr:hypothetical protein [Enterovibrio norvegicus]OEE62947.1 hypothetical protein A1OK_20410 [Enterovibrio norvegicus FF-454]OEE66871.1 hypothetical protein A1OO_13990 [Enterovibrio norvegicus FF-33]OEE74907.1 hypothetical protein A1OQ_08230 [Enterovibrio norvegicus FF-162]